MKEAVDSFSIDWGKSQSQEHPFFLIAEKSKREKVK
jgi:hypothetical protein